MELTRNHSSFSVAISPLFGTLLLDPTRVVPFETRLDLQRFPEREVVRLTRKRAEFATTGLGTSQHASRQFHDRAYWLSLAPGLHIEDGARSDNIDSVEFSPALAAQFRDDDYLQGSADWGADAKLMADAICSLRAASLPPLFAYLFDEFWFPLFKLHNLYRALLCVW